MKLIKITHTNQREAVARELQNVKRSIQAINLQGLRKQGLICDLNEFSNLSQKHKRQRLL